MKDLRMWYMSLINCALAPWHQNAWKLERQCSKLPWYWKNLWPMWQTPLPPVSGLHRWSILRKYCTWVRNPVSPTFIQTLLRQISRSRIFIRILTQGFFFAFSIRSTKAFQKNLYQGFMAIFFPGSSLSDHGFYPHIRIKLLTLNWPIFIRIINQAF